MSEIVIVESPLNAPTPEGIRENLRYVLWCCRAEYEAGNRPLATHMFCPWFMNDADPQERSDGIGWPGFWNGDPHNFWLDRGMSGGMLKGSDRCTAERIPFSLKMMRDERPDMWEAFLRGKWPPHTKGFEL